MVMLEAKFKPNIHGVRKEIAARDNRDNATLIGVLVKANVVTYLRRPVGQEDGGVPEGAMSAKSSPVRPLSVENANDKVWEADPNLKRIWQYIKGRKDAFSVSYVL